MTIGEIVRQGLYYARTCRSLWLFGFFVGISSGGGGSNGGGGGTGSHGGAGVAHFSGTTIAFIVIAILLVAAVVFVLRFVGEGALIEGIVRARQGGVMTTSEGFRAGWAHWGVLLRIGLLYLAVNLGSVVLLVAPCAIALWMFGPFAAILVCIPALLIAVPWLVTLYLVQAFAFRIAVLENRRALDAIRKARLFLHGRLLHGLKLIVATFLGTLAIVVVGLVAMAPAALVLAALIPVLRLFPVIVMACLLLVPAICLLTAIVGTFRSSVWTIGYVTQVES
jgi:hypothetical protein